MSNKCFVILNDGETYTKVEKCVIYDYGENKIYRIRKDKEIKIDSLENMHWEKGISEIRENEYDLPW